MHFDNVLFPLDFSKHSRSCVVESARLFGDDRPRHGHFLYVLHTPTDFSTWTGDPTVDARQQLDEMVRGNPIAETTEVAVAEGHALAEQEAIDLRALAHEPLLLLADGHCLRDQVLDLCHASTGIANANTRETGLETLLALVAAGDGVTLVPALTRAREERGRRDIVLRRETSGAAGRIVRLACRASFPRRELVNRLASIIRTCVPEILVTILN